MSRNAVPCASCGRPMAVSKSSLPAGQAMCQPCRRIRAGRGPLDKLPRSKEPRRCRMCDMILENKKAYYCASCRSLALLRHRADGSARIAAWRAANPDRAAAHDAKVNRRQRPAPHTRGYGAEHRQLRKEWAVKVAAGGVCCARCGLTIPPGAPWDLGHDPQDRSRYWGPEHRRCNRGWNRLGDPGARGMTSNPYEPKKKTAERGLGSEHVKLRRRLLPLAYGKPCPYCGETMFPNQELDLDHVIPRVLGGSNGPVRIAHRTCNRREGAKLAMKLRTVRSG